MSQESTILLEKNETAQQNITKFAISLERINMFIRNL